MTNLLAGVTLALLLVGCSSDYTSDGVTVVSYCLLGGVYIDDTKTTHSGVAAPGSCPSRVAK